MLLLARPRSRAADPEAVRAAAREVVDWDSFIALATRHGVLPLVHAAEGLRWAPEQAQARVAAAYRSNARRGVVFGAELLRVSEALGRQDVRCLALKGPVLAAQVYGDMTLRQFDDLDLLVHPNDLESAVAVLLAAGYSPMLPADAGEGRYPLRARHDIVFRRRGTDTVVELHWRLSRPRQGLRLSTDGAFARAQTVRFLDRRLLTLGPMDLFVYLAVHASAHHWRRLEHFHALAELVTRCDEVDWSVLGQWAERQGAVRRVHTAVLLLADALDVPWDGRALCEARADAIASRLAHEARGAWARTDAPAHASLRPALVQMSSLDSPGAMARNVLSLALDPDESEWSWVALPRSLHPLYYLVRPLRLGSVYLRRAAGRGGHRAGLW